MPDSAITPLHPYWSRTPGPGEMWCENFDADLLNVVPGALESLGDTAYWPLLVHGHETNGKLNHPSCWNSYDGVMAAYFWTPDSEHLGPPDGYLTDSPVVACTFAEAIRDAWCHSPLTVSVNQRFVWLAEWRPFEQLMYDARGWASLPAGVREAIREHVRHSLRGAADRLREAVNGG